MHYSCQSFKNWELYFKWFLLFPDSSITAKTGGCFSADNQVSLAGGRTLSMADLKVGDSVLTTGPDGLPVFSPVVMFLHREQSGVAKFLTLKTEGNRRITLSPSHLIHVSLEPSGTASVMFARDVKPGHYLRTLEGRNASLAADKVVQVLSDYREGVYAPLTKHGTIIVNGVSSSCYAVIQSQTVAHTFLAPVRWTYDLLEYFGKARQSRMSDLPNGVHWYVQMLYDLSWYLVPQNMMYSVWSGLSSLSCYPQLLSGTRSSVAQPSQMQMVDSTSLSSVHDLKIFNEKRDLFSSENDPSAQRKASNPSEHSKHALTIKDRKRTKGRWYAELSARCPKKVTSRESRTCMKWTLYDITSTKSRNIFHKRQSEFSRSHVMAYSWLFSLVASVTWFS